MHEQVDSQAILDSQRLSFIWFINGSYCTHLVSIHRSFTCAPCAAPRWASRWVFTIFGPLSLWPSHSFWGLNLIKKCPPVPTILYRLAVSAPLQCTASTCDARTCAYTDPGLLHDSRRYAIPRCLDPSHPDTEVRLTDLSIYLSAYTDPLRQAALAPRRAPSRPAGREWGRKYGTSLSTHFLFTKS